ncbi:MAG: hypothetical protein H8K03_14570 [Nitrospira sp.]
MMTTIITKGAALWMVVLLAALSLSSIPPAQAEDSHVKGTMISPPTEELAVPIGERAVVASGAAEDTLTACKARIPELASAGQHLLADQTCAGEEETRKTIRSAPKF